MPLGRRHALLCLPLIAVARAAPARAQPLPQVPGLTPQQGGTTPPPSWQRELQRQIDPQTAPSRQRSGSAGTPQIPSSSSSAGRRGAASSSSGGGRARSSAPPRTSSGGRSGR